MSSKLLGHIESKSENYSVMSDSLQLHGLYSPWISPGQNIGVGSHSLLQGIFPTQGSNPGLSQHRWILYSLRHQGSLIMKAVAAAAKSLQLCPTLWDPIDSSPPGSSIPGILQARTLEWVAISFSNAWKWKVKVRALSCVRLLATHGLKPTRLLHPWDFPGKSTGVLNVKK